MGGSLTKIKNLVRKEEDATSSGQDKTTEKNEADVIGRGEETPNSGEVGQASGEKNEPTAKSKSTNLQVGPTITGLPRSSKRSLASPTMRSKAVSPQTTKAAEVRLPSRSSMRVNVESRSPTIPLAKSTLRICSTNEQDTSSIRRSKRVVEDRKSSLNCPCCNTFNKESSANKSCGSNRPIAQKDVPTGPRSTSATPTLIAQQDQESSVSASRRRFKRSLSESNSSLNQLCQQEQESSANKSRSAKRVAIAENIVASKPCSTSTSKPSSTTVKQDQKLDESKARHSKRCLGDSDSSLNLTSDNKQDVNQEKNGKILGVKKPKVDIGLLSSSGTVEQAAMKTASTVRVSSNAFVDHSTTSNVKMSGSNVRCLEKAAKTSNPTVKQVKVKSEHSHSPLKSQHKNVRSQSLTRFGVFDQSRLESLTSDIRKSPRLTQTTVTSNSPTSSKTELKKMNTQNSSNIVLQIQTSISAPLDNSTSNKRKENNHKASRSEQVAIESNLKAKQVKVKTERSHSSLKSPHKNVRSQSLTRSGSSLGVFDQSSLESFTNDIRKSPRLTQTTVTSNSPAFSKIELKLMNTRHSSNTELPIQTSNNLDNLTATQHQEGSQKKVCSEQIAIKSNVKSKQVKVKSEPSNSPLKSPNKNVRFQSLTRSGSPLVIFDQSRLESSTSDIRKSPRLTQTTVASNSPAFSKTELKQMNTQNSSNTELQVQVSNNASLDNSTANQRQETRCLEQAAIASKLTVKQVKVKSEPSNSPLKSPHKRSQSLTRSGSSLVIFDQSRLESSTSDIRKSLRLTQTTVTSNSPPKSKQKEVKFMFPKTNILFELLSEQNLKQSVEKTKASQSSINDKPVRQRNARTPSPCKPTKVTSKVSPSSINDEQVKQRNARTPSPCKPSKVTSKVSPSSINDEQVKQRNARTPSPCKPTKAKVDVSPSSNNVEPVKQRNERTPSPYKRKKAKTDVSKRLSKVDTFKLRNERTPSPCKLETMTTKASPSFKKVSPIKLKIKRFPSSSKPTKVKIKVSLCSKKDKTIKRRDKRSEQTVSPGVRSKSPTKNTLNLIPKTVLTRQEHGDWAIKQVENKLAQKSQKSSKRISMKTDSVLSIQNTNKINVENQKLAKKRNQPTDAVVKIINSMQVEKSGKHVSSFAQAKPANEENSNLHLNTTNAKLSKKFQRKEVLSPLVKPIRKSDQKVIIVEKSNNVIVSKTSTLNKINDTSKVNTVNCLKKNTNNRSKTKDVKSKTDELPKKKRVTKLSPILKKGKLLQKTIQKRIDYKPSLSKRTKLVRINDQHETKLYETEISKPLSSVSLSSEQSPAKPLSSGSLPSEPFLIKSSSSVSAPEPSSTKPSSSVSAFSEPSTAKPSPSLSSSAEPSATSSTLSSNGLNSQLNYNDEDDENDADYLPQKEDEEEDDEESEEEDWSAEEADDNQDSDDDVIEIKAILPNRNSLTQKPKMRYKLSQNNVIDLYQQDFDCFQPFQHINDNVVNIFFNELKFSYSKRGFSFHTLDTTFTRMLFDLTHTNQPGEALQKLVDTKYRERLWKWQRNENFFYYDYLLFPFCFAQHWVLPILVNPRNLSNFCPNNPARLIMLNSMQNLNSDQVETFLYVILAFLRMELAYKSDLIVEMDDMICTLLEPLTPQQDNTYDCAFYMFEFAEVFLSNPREFIQKTQSGKTCEMFKKNNFRLKRVEMQHFLNRLVTTGRASLVQDKQEENGVLGASSSKNNTCGQSSACRSNLPSTLASPPSLKASSLPILTNGAKSNLLKKVIAPSTSDKVCGLKKTKSTTAPPASNKVCSSKKTNSITSTSLLKSKNNAHVQELNSASSSKVNSGGQSSACRSNLLSTSTSSSSSKASTLLLSMNSAKNNPPEKMIALPTTDKVCTSQKAKSTTFLNQKSTFLFKSKNNANVKELNSASSNTIKTGMTNISNFKQNGLDKNKSQIETIELDNEEPSTESSDQSKSLQTLAERSLMKYQLSEGSLIDVYTKDLLCFGEAQHINDNIANIFFNELKYKHADTCKIFSFDTLFTSKLLNLALTVQNEDDAMVSFEKSYYESWHKWFIKEDLFAKDYLFFPMCHQSHWFLVIVSNPTLLTKDCYTACNLLILDSPLIGSKSTIPKLDHIILSFLKLELKCKKRLNYHIASLNYEVMQPKLPKLYNEYDCGFYVFEYADVFMSDPNSFIDTCSTNTVKSLFNQRKIINKRGEMQEFIFDLQRAGRAWAIRN